MMLETNTAILLTMLVPALATVTNMVFRDRENLRDGLTFVAAVVTFILVLIIHANTGGAQTETNVLFTVMPGLTMAFNVEPLGLLFATIASGLWIVTHIFGIGYMRGNNEGHHARFFSAFSFAIADEDRAGLRDRGETYRAPHVVGEHEERAAHRNHASVRSHAVHDRAHGVLSNTEVHLLALGGLTSKLVGALEQGAGIA